MLKIQKRFKLIISNEHARVTIMSVSMQSVCEKFPILTLRLSTVALSSQKIDLFPEDRQRKIAKLWSRSRGELTNAYPEIRLQ